MSPDIYNTCLNDPAVVALIDDGSGGIKFYSHGEADEKEPVLYATWQTVYGSPENYLGQNPDTDLFGTQIDCWASDAEGLNGRLLARQLAQAIRDAVQEICHIVSWNGESRDPVTRRYRYSFTVDWWQERS